MHYFVTGATGFIGRRLVKALLARKGAVVHFLIRAESADRAQELLEYWGVDKTRAIAVPGDLTEPGLGVSRSQRQRLQAHVKHFFHLAAVYDLKADPEAQERVNVAGTRNTVAFAAEIGAECFHHVSSIAAAGLYEGVFREDMFEEAEELDHPYFKTKHDSERIVREECAVPWRIYRPGIVVGDSRTGEMDKIDGPYYFFKLIQRMRQILPPWMPSIGIEGGRINIVPVDFVVDALVHIAHLRGKDGKCFHLVDPTPYRVGDVLNVFARAGHAPAMAMRVNAALLGFIPRGVKKGLLALTPVRRIRNAVMKDLGLPEDILTFVNYPTRFDCRETQAALVGSGIEVPRLEDYAWRLWDYWERHLDPALSIDRTLKGQVRGKVVLITGVRPASGSRPRRRSRRRAQPLSSAAGMPKDSRRPSARRKRRGTRSSPTRPTSPTTPSAMRSSRRSMTSMVVSISWSTTPAARSGGQSTGPSTASTTSSAPWRSTTSARSASLLACCPR